MAPATSRRRINLAELVDKLVLGNGLKVFGVTGDRVYVDVPGKAALVFRDFPHEPQITAEDLVDKLVEAEYHNEADDFIEQSYTKSEQAVNYPQFGVIDTMSQLRRCVEDGTSAYISIGLKTTGDHQSTYLTKANQLLERVLRVQRMSESQDNLKLLADYIKERALPRVRRQPFADVLKQRLIDVYYLQGQIKDAISTTGDNPTLRTYLAEKLETTARQLRETPK